LVRVHEIYADKNSFGSIRSYIEKLLNEGYSVKICKADEPELFVIRSWKPPKKVDIKSENLKETQ
jgi:hypothetical protein